MDAPHAMDWTAAKETVDRFLTLVIESSRMEISYEIRGSGGSGGSEATGELKGERTRLRVIFSGADTGLMVARHAELLHAMESLATSLLRLTPEEHDLISFDAEEYKAKRTSRSGGPRRRGWRPCAGVGGLTRFRR